MTNHTNAIIRDYRPSDRDSAYYICLKTGDHGNDAEPLFTEDPDALGRIYVGPYLEFEPDLAFMLEDEEGLCGYVLGALDSRQFYDRFENEWRPGLCRHFAAPDGERSSWTRVQSVYHHYHHPDYFCPEPYENYPSHLHIDLLPRAQGQGNGRRLMEQLMERLQSHGSAGVHLGLSAANDRAYQFYTALGFEELLRRGEGADGSIFLGRRFSS